VLASEPVTTLVCKVAFIALFRVLRGQLAGLHKQHHPTIRLSVSRRGCNSGHFRTRCLQGRCSNTWTEVPLGFVPLFSKGAADNHRGRERKRQNLRGNVIAPSKGPGHSPNSG
jgi:hypothetical protein